MRSRPREQRQRGPPPPPLRSRLRRPQLRHACESQPRAYPPAARSWRGLRRAAGPRASHALQAPRGRTSRGEAALRTKQWLRTREIARAHAQIAAVQAHPSYARPAASEHGRRLMLTVNHLCRVGNHAPARRAPPRRPRRPKLLRRRWSHPLPPRSSLRKQLLPARRRLQRRPHTDRRPFLGRLIGSSPSTRCRRNGSSSSAAAAVPKHGGQQDEHQHHQR